MDTPRIACVGCGYWGRNLVRNFHQLGALAALCDDSPERRRELQEQYPGVPVVADFEEILHDDGIDAVVIATPAETHASLARRALLAGKDVFVEKPLALAVEEATELDRLAVRLGRVLMVGHLLWYHPAVLRLKQMIDDGELGRIQYIYSNRLNLGKIRREENILWSFAPHDVSVILGLVGETPDAIDARGGNYLHNGISDVTVSLLSFPSGVRGHIFVSWLHPFKEQKLVVVGDRRMAVFNDLEPTAKLTVFPHSIDWRNGVPVPNKAEGEVVPIDSYEPLRAECEHFLECITTRGTPRTDAREAIRVLEVLHACQERIELAHTAPDRRLKVELFRAPAPTKLYVAHETACIDEGAEIGEGTTIWHFSHVLPQTSVGKNCRIGQNVVIGPNAQIGSGVKIQNNVSVYEGVTLEDDVFCGPSMVFTNVYNPRSEIRRMHEIRPTLVRKGASLGANCTVVCGITIGRYAFVGAGAVVLRDVPDHALVVGNPGKIIGWMCVCGERIHFAELDGLGECTVCDRTYLKEKNSVTLLNEEMAAV
jgi:UDP-2-acetamido-3-amino-2,3-dideoxy-glucuronate N-acetyltransferase